MGTIEEGARNAVEVCMGLKDGEKVLIVTDVSQLKVGEALKRAAENATPSGSVNLFVLEEISKRPLASLPKLIEDAIPSVDVTLWAASSKLGELAARRRFMNQAKHFARHGHMPNVTQLLMEQGMCADYASVYTLTHKVFEAVRKASSIRITNHLGADVTAEFDTSWRWVPSDGRYHEKGRWGNLPEGETFTAPKKLNGRIATNLLGDWFSEKYGSFKDTLSFEVHDSRIDLLSLECLNEKLKSEILEYLQTDENSNRASEFALPTNPLLISLPTVGNLLQDEKARPHIAFGDPYSEETGAPWGSKTHVDMLLEKCDVFVDGRKIMQGGQYLF